MRNSTVDAKPFPPDRLLCFYVPTINDGLQVQDEIPSAEPIRLSRRVAQLAPCTRAEAEQYIEGGWVTVDGIVVDDPRSMVTTQTVEFDPQARLEAIEPATLLFHKPAGIAFETVIATPELRSIEDTSGIRLLRRHFAHLMPLMPLDSDASGLIVLSQDGRAIRRLTEDRDSIEQEFLVEVEGALDGPYGLSRLSRGLSYKGRALPSCKVSWQNETKLRFAIKAVRPGQLRDMCTQVGLKVLSIRRLRIGRIPLRKMLVGEWRYLPVSERF